MTGPDLRLLLSDAVQDAERGAPPPEPLAALRRVQRERQQRRAHATGLAFAVFVVLLQVLPAEAFGAHAPATDGHPSLTAAPGLRVTDTAPDQPVRLAADTAGPRA